MVKICLSISKMDPEFEELVEKLKPVSEIDVVGLDVFSLKGYDIYIGKKLSIELLDTCDKLQAIFAYKTGVDDFPLEQLEKRNISLYNSHADSKVIAEYAIGLSISLVNRITEFDKKLRNGIWYDNENMYWKSFFSMKVGLLGYGHIGKEIHKILLNNNIESYTLKRSKEYLNIKTCDTLEDLARTCDIIICSLPKTSDTDNMINKDILSLMKGKYIVNVGRSNSINQEDLYNSLVNKEIAGASIDTWDSKPRDFYTKLMPSKMKFEELDNIILSPHAAMRVADGHRRYVIDVYQNVMRYLTDSEPTNKVNYKKGY